MKLSVTIILLCVFPVLKADFILKILVRNSTDRLPVQGCRVALLKGGQAEITDSAGRVNLEFEQKTDSLFLSFTAIGFESSVLRIAYPRVPELEVLLNPEETEVGEITVTSVRTDSRIEDLPTRVEVLGIDDVNEENGIKPGNISSLLGDIAGIQMQQVSASSGNSYARIQGLNGRYTQILKDGMPLYGGMSGNFGVLQIPPLDLKQIEIIKGSVSTLYGGDAIGGIINLVSKDPGGKPEMAVTTNQSTLKETNVNFYTARKFKKMGYTFFGGYTLQNPKDVNGDSLSDVPWIRSTVLHPKLLFYVSKKTTLTLNYTATLDGRKGGEMNYFGSFRDSFYHVSHQIFRQNADLKFLHDISVNERITFKISGSSYKQNTDATFSNLSATQRVFYSEISWFRKLEKMNWVAGINFNGDLFRNQTPSDKITPGAVLADYHYFTAGAFVQNTWHPVKKFTVESGFRLDHHNVQGFIPLPRVSLMYKFNSYITGRINGGLGYKIPTVISYVNPETDIPLLKQRFSLKAELSQGVNADVNYARRFSKKVHLTANQAFFYTRLNFPVSDTSTSAGIKQLINQASPLITAGLQTYINLSLHDWEIYAGYVFTHVRKTYDKVNRQLPVTPAHNISAVLVREFGDHFRAGIESSYIAGQLDQNYKPVQNYLLLAAMVSCHYGNFVFVLNGENLLDYRQNKSLRVYDGTLSRPVFHALWAPIDGRVINLSVKYKIR